MVTTNHSFEEQARRSIAEIQTELNALVLQRQQLDDMIAKLTKMSEAYQLVLEHESQKRGADYATGPDWEQLLKGLTRKEQILAIAKRKDGRFRVADVADILFTSGISQSSSRKNAYLIVYGMAKDMEADGLLEKVGPAEFEIPKAPQFSLPETE